MHERLLVNGVLSNGQALSNFDNFPDNIPITESKKQSTERCKHKKRKETFGNAMF